MPFPCQSCIWYENIFVFIVYILEYLLFLYIPEKIITMVIITDVIILLKWALNITVKDVLCCEAALAWNPGCRRVRVAP